MFCVLGKKNSVEGSEGMDIFKKLVSNHSKKPIDKSGEAANKRKENDEEQNEKKVEQMKKPVVQCRPMSSSNESTQDSQVNSKDKTDEQYEKKNMSNVQDEEVSAAKEVHKESVKLKFGKEFENNEAVKQEKPNSKPIHEEQVQKDKEETPLLKENIASLIENQFVAGRTEVLSEMQKQFRLLQVQMTNLNSEFSSKIKYDEQKDKMIDNLHHELQGYRENIIQERLMPVVTDLILTIDRTNRLVHQLEQEEKVDTEKLFYVIKDIVQDLEDTLYKQGIETNVEESSTFNYRSQKIVKTIKTAEVSKDKEIAERHGKGYEWNGKLIRRELVSVYVTDEGVSQEQAQHSNK